MKKTFYQEPRIEVCEVSVEMGIAVSTSEIYGTTAGDPFDEIIYGEEL